MNIKSSFLILSLALLLICSVLVMSASAEVIVTFSDLGIDQNQKILLYSPTAPGNETLIGEYNTSSTVVLSNGIPYIIAFKPSTWDTLNNPLEALELFKASVPVGLSVAIFLFAVTGGFALWIWIFRKR